MNRMLSVPDGLQDTPGFARTFEAEIVVPFMSQTPTEPLSLRQTMSVLPSLLKSPVPTMCQEGPGFPATTPERVTVVPFISQMPTEPLSFCQRISYAVFCLKKKVTM